MALFNYTCDKCSFTDEYIVYLGLADGKEPTTCPKCNEGKMVRQFSTGKTMAFDIVGSCYTNDYGPKAWKKRLSQEDQARVLTPDANGQYKDPY